MSTTQIQFAVNVLNIIISATASGTFIYLYRRLTRPGVTITDKHLYQEITDYNSEDLKDKIDGNELRVENLSKQFLTFVIGFALSLVAVYLIIILHSFFQPTPPSHPIQSYYDPNLQIFFKPVVERTLTILDWFTNAVNFSGAVFIYLGFKVLRDKSLSEDNKSSTRFWFYPLLWGVAYIVLLAIFYAVFDRYYLNDPSWRHDITIFLNLTDLVAGMANGLSMALFFGRFVSIDQSLKETKIAKTRFRQLAQTIHVKDLFSKIAIFVLPVYALAQPLFGSLEIDAFGDAKVFQTGVYFICLIGKTCFFLLVYILVKDRLIQLYLHGIVARVGNFKGLESCLDLNAPKSQE